MSVPKTARANLRRTRESAWTGWPPSAITSATYASLHGLLALYAYTSLTAFDFIDLWSGRLGFGPSLLQLSAAVSALLAGYVAVDVWRVLSRRERDWKRAVVTASGFVLQVLVLIYLWSVAGVVDVMVSYR